MKSKRNDLQNRGVHICTSELNPPTKEANGVTNDKIAAVVGALSTLMGMAGFSFRASRVAVVYRVVNH
jgi:hypothetical protein